MKKHTSTCPQCQSLGAEVATLRKEIAQLREQLAAAKKSSSTSSKPPSSDLVKPKPPCGDGDESQRKIGGQPGHPMHERDPFSTAEITLFETHELDACPQCGGDIRRNGPLQRVVQQVDIEETPLTIEQHTCLEYWCDRCNRPCAAPLPLKIERGGLVGPMHGIPVLAKDKAKSLGIELVELRLADTAYRRSSR